MPRGRSTFTKAPDGTRTATETTGPSRRRNQGKQEKSSAGSVDEMAELREHRAEQAALFHLGAENASAAEESSGDHVNE